MQAFSTVTGVMAYLPIANIDTDMIIPKQYLKTVKRTGLGNHLFAELRYDQHNNPQPDFILNKPGFQETKILLSEENFGCGSSREHAVWSLIDFGIRVIIAPSFADIFYSNCLKNGLLAITLSQPTIQKLVEHQGSLLTVNLESQMLSTETLEILFPIDSYRRQILLKGLDEIGETLSYEQQIKDFEKKQSLAQPWLYFGGINHA
ncbi:3-isopropylmalate dehydratase small subunit [Legionella massiliensis]|uniref:3-isopropylmalate dehydratase small subunit n=1 Tax=Legionella massiliensis TaxID=1034943 RepID=A0A078L4B7_9GAMM|nr:3-isopropylmalate dehydratase small subunit [Legionella massiliensis]CDZ78783.1 3-isopropylmalate dehydratase small subunit [Legionella massiliensis]CEE14521.1 3-isopropylmalate dehydratase small subunit [Legionella massiliensis]